MSIPSFTKTRFAAYAGVAVLGFSVFGAGLADAKPGGDHGRPGGPAACGHAKAKPVTCTSTSTATTGTTSGATTACRTKETSATSTSGTTTSGTTVTTTGTNTAGTTVTTTTGTTTTDNTTSLATTGTLTTTTTTTNTTTTGTSTSAANTSGGAAQSFIGKATPSHPCGTIKVKAKVRHPLRGTTFDASATAHFAGGDVTVSLRRAGKSYVAVGKIPVPGDQPAGLVAVDISIVYGGVTTTITTMSRIVAP